MLSVLFFVSISIQAGIAYAVVVVCEPFIPGILNTKPFPHITPHSQKTDQFTHSI